MRPLNRLNSEIELGGLSAHAVLQIGIGLAAKPLQGLALAAVAGTFENFTTSPGIAATAAAIPR